jgi:hypothetical protein
MKAMKKVDMKRVTSTDYSPLLLSKISNLALYFYSFPFMVEAGFS